MTNPQDANAIAKNLQGVRQNIADFAKKYHRGDSVQLLAVSKTKPIADILACVEAGQTAFGENYLQEAVQKISALKDLNLQWHFIGDLQSNKTKQVAQNFDWFHTLHREKIAKRLHEQRPKNLGKLNVCIEVNIDAEPNKSGISAIQVLDFAKEIQVYTNLNLRGLMCIPKHQTQVSQQKIAFAKMQDLFLALQKELPQANIDTLSMGMSSDLEAAISQGATIVRVGTDIFGARNYA